MTEEHRRSPRAHGLHFVADESDQILRTLDLSHEGMLIELEEHEPLPALGDPVALRIAIGEEVVKVQARVVRHVEHGEEPHRRSYAIHWENLDPRVQELIDTAVSDWMAAS
ncbi:MAG: PilZ domain-containing protein [Planctomycetota bacterium]|jgi:c-di-GMP-binding flagellar brake protein YcgR